MYLNKICLTQRGLDLISHDRSEFMPQANLTTSRKSSLPMLGSIASLSNSHFEKSTQKDLSRMSMQLIKLERIGLKTLRIREDDQEMKRALVSQMKKRDGRGKVNRYLQLVIPEVVKKTRNKNKCGNLKSRVERGRAYIDRLQLNYQSASLQRIGNKRLPPIEI